MRPFGLSITQFSVLANLSVLNGCGVGELARQLQLEKSTLARTLKPLLNAGYIQDVAPKNVRPRQLCLTQSGADILSAAWPAWKEAQRNIQSKLSMDAKKLMEALAEIA
jgi:DNA-binding MarR family transcriptional regulator